LTISFILSLLCNRQQFPRPCHCRLLRAIIKSLLFPLIFSLPHEHRLELADLAHAHSIGANSCMLESIIRMDYYLTTRAIPSHALVASLPGSFDAPPILHAPQLGVARVRLPCAYVLQPLPFIPVCTYRRVKHVQLPFPSSS